MKVGARVVYTPTMIEGDTVVTGVIEMLEPAGSIFRMDMLVIDTVTHWIPVRDCKEVADAKDAR